MTLRTIILIVFTCLLAGCALKDPDRRLADIAASVDDNPRLALTRLDSISPGSLSPADRHFYDFLRVKAADKAYIPHSSDSLILDVIEFEAGHRGTGRYPEALYYGGRVYSDLGDYPTALRYFQDALTETDPERDRHLRGNILSQTGRLLNKLRLYDQALPYLQQVLQIDSVECDTFNLTYDHELTGSVYLNAGNTGKAMHHFTMARDLASNLSPADRANMTMHLAACALKTHNTDSALSLIRGNPDSVAPNYRNISLAYASDIYLRAGIPDTAYIYAFELAHSDDANNRRFGYGHLLSPELISLSDPDSLIIYISEYKKILNDNFNSHSAQQALMQQSLYNYQIHERGRIKAEKSRDKATILCLILLSLALAVTTAFLMHKIKVKHTIIRLHETIARLEIIRNMTDGPSDFLSGATQSVCPEVQVRLSTEDDQVTDTEGRDNISSDDALIRSTGSDDADGRAERPSGDAGLDTNVGAVESSVFSTEATYSHISVITPGTRMTEAISPDRAWLRNQLKSMIESIETNIKDKPVPGTITNSPPYLTLKKSADKGTAIPDSYPIWEDIYAVILQSSPEFATKLHVLIGSNIKPHELHTIILIKCGFTPTQMSIILGKTKGSISSRREAIGFKLLGIKTGVKVVNALIRSL